ncbi:hypothetical protein ACFOLJ_29790 [Rugamonas sp. CCM 8940]|uniref:hypothetical protein n=1 Tax=Rugamonas sp. CCM 8940 TaxID=2765359 RepID=UPI0018F28E9C|nr:hypothetical protein [Rugamonas sp. CCM 8940]MBJ7313019.1 hypothetical protein [Rugamonas sp. CCM 8940]
MKQSKPVAPARFTPATPRQPAVPAPFTPLTASKAGARTGPPAGLPAPLQARLATPPGNRPAGPPAPTPALLPRAALPGPARQTIQRSLEMLGVAAVGATVLTAGYFLWSRFAGTTGNPGSTTATPQGKKQQQQQQRNTHPTSAVKKKPTRPPSITIVATDARLQQLEAAAQAAGKQRGMSQRNQYLSDVKRKLGGTFPAGYREAVETAYYLGAHSDNTPDLRLHHVEDDGSGWQTVEDKPLLSSNERQSKRDVKLFAYAAKALQILEAATIGAETNCVLLDSNGNVKYSGTNQGIAKAGRKREARDALSTSMSKIKSQATGYGGIACAEPDALMKMIDDMKVKSSGLRPCFSLAYSKKDGAKPACADCTRQLTEAQIGDLYPWTD